MINIVLVLFIVITLTLADKRLSVQVNNISPWNNPIETYTYYMLPYCKPKNLFSTDQTFGQSLSGDRKMSSPYNFSIETNTTRSLVCQKNMSKDDIDHFKHVIRENYTAEFYIGDFRVHDIIGHAQEGRIFLKNHLKFVLFISTDETEVLMISKAKLHSVIIHTPEAEDFIDISYDPPQVDFFISAIIYKTDKKINIVQGDGIELEGEFNFQWSPIIIKGSFILSMIMIITYILRRALKRDFQVLSESDIEMDRTEDIGWKLVRVEALMVPQSRIIFAAMIGTGMQFMIILLIELGLGWTGIYYGHKGTIKTTGIISYAFTGFFNGYYSASYYKFLGGKKWAFNIVIAIALFPGSMIMTGILINLTAWYWESTAVIPFRALFFIGFLWSVVYIPLNVVGGISGRLRMVDQMPTASIKRYQKPIPQPKSFFGIPFVRFLMIGFITFCTVHYEISQIFLSTWGHYNFHLYSMLLVAFLETVLVVGCLSIIQTYYNLNQQDYRWWWMSFFNGGSIGAILLIYSIYFYFFVSSMSGLISAAFFFGYSILSSMVAGLIFGTVGFLASFRFVFYLYGQAKGE